MGCMAWYWPTIGSYKLIKYIMGKELTPVYSKDIHWMLLCFVLLMINQLCCIGNENYSKSIMTQFTDAYMLPEAKIREWCSRVIKILVFFWNWNQEVSVSISRWYSPNEKYPILCVCVCVYVCVMHCMAWYWTEIIFQLIILKKKRKKINRRWSHHPI